MENGLAPDCIYDNVEYKADVFKYDNQENLDYIEPTTNTDTPFRTTSDGTTWYETFNSISCVDSYQHSSSSDGFIKKFRTWRVPVPRQDRGRMRDSWIRIKLENENPSEYKFVLRDIFVDAFY